MALRAVDMEADPVGQRAGALREGLDGEQVPAHVGVDDDRVGRAVGIARAGERAALQPLPRVATGLLVGRLGGGETLQPDGEAGGVHHGEHRGHALVGGTHQPAHGVLELQGAGGRGADAHLVLDAGAADAVALAGTPAVRPLGGEELGHDEEADAARAGGGIGQLREHQMDDVLGQVVLAGADEDLGAGHAAAAVVCGHGPGANQAEVGATLRLGQAHGARPRAVGELGQEDPLQPLVGMRRERIVGAVAKAGIDGEREIGAGEHLLERDVDQFRQALAAPLGGGGDPGPAAGAERRVGRLESPRRSHDAVLVGAALLVAGAVQRRELALGKLGRLLEHAVDQLGRGLLAAWQLGERLRTQQLVQDEPHVA